MLGNKYAGNSIAEEFQRILDKNRQMKKEAQALFESPAEDDPIEDILSYKPEGETLPDPESFLMAIDEQTDDISGALDSSIDAMSQGETCMDKVQKPSHADYFDATAGHILNGLGKISASLKSKGHSFASDIVEATAMSIKDDYVKEAEKRIAVTTELQKMAKDLSESGNQIASDMVLVTIEKIKKG
jgi:hypothetical protein